MQLHEFTSPHGRHEVIERSAEISECGRYRYSLRRRWTGQPLVTGEREVCWLMLNPSTADAELDDPTIVRCMKFSARWGFVAMTVVNLFPFRSSSPKVCAEWLKSGPDVLNDPMLHNWTVIHSRADDCAFHVVAFGANVLLEPHLMKLAVLRFHHGAGMDDDLYCLGKSSQGFPLHPMARGRLRVPDDVTPSIWRITDMAGDFGRL